MLSRQHTAPGEAFDYESVTWAGGPIIDPDEANFLDHSLHLRWLLESIKDVSGRAIEIGCGSGRFVASLAAARPDMECHGSDLSMSALKVAARPNLRMARTDAENLPYADGSFNVVVMVDVLEHLVDLDAGLREIRRILAPGGVFHLVFPCEGHPWTLLGRIDKLQDLKREYCGHLQRLGPKELKKRLKASGLNPVDERYSYFAFGQLYDAAIYIAFDRGMDIHAARQDKVENNPNSAVNRVRRAISRLLYAEAKVLSRVPMGMTIHVSSK